jgi:crotonobetainyl-CoA:carnitine CoA-transferase CaiB-like acyl-CoA transferase
VSAQPAVERRITLQTQHRLPLDGIKVVTFEHVIVAPLCTRYLVDLDAHVMEVVPVPTTLRATTMNAPAE